jgi:alkylation response protein AidB-like acyl-CoA dehydrogenase
MPVSVKERLLDTPEEEALLDLVAEISREELAPRVAKDESDARFPGDLYRLLGASGLLSLPFREEFGGSGVKYRTYLQVLEELSATWLSLGIGVSVHTLSASPMEWLGSAEQQQRWLPSMLDGRHLGAYCLSEPGSGSDAASLTTRAEEDPEGWRIRGEKAWITHGPVADFYAVFARTGGTGARGISLFYLKPGDEVIPARPERKMGTGASPTSGIVFDGAFVPDADRIGEVNHGFSIAMRALDAGRLGIAACAVGLAQSGLDLAAAYCRERQQFGKSISEFQGVRWSLADMQASIFAARACYLDAAMRYDKGEAFSVHAAAAKLIATDTAMRVTTDVVQLLGGNGYVSDYPAERLFREAKVLQIVEGTNQVQREILGRHVTAP